MNDAFGNWLAGFVDGEGCFSLNACGPLTLAGTRAIKCSLTVSLRADDLPILEEARELTGCGTVRTADYSGGVPNHWPRAVWVVCDRQGSSRICDLFDRYPLRAKKARDYALWREAVYEWNGLNRRERMEAFKVALSGIRRYESRHRPLAVPTPAHEQTSMEVGA